MKGCRTPAWALLAAILCVLAGGRCALADPEDDLPERDVCEEEWVQCPVGTTCRTGLNGGPICERELAVSGQGEVVCWSRGSAPQSCPSHAGVTCFVYSAPNDMRCRKCVPLGIEDRFDNCPAFTCPTGCTRVGQTCDCTPVDPCTGVSCSQGETCRNGSCECSRDLHSHDEIPCHLTGRCHSNDDCSGADVCQLSGRAGTCVDPPPPPTCNPPCDRTQTCDTAQSPPQCVPEECANPKHAGYPDCDECANSKHAGYPDCDECAGTATNYPACDRLECRPPCTGGLVCDPDSGTCTVPPPSCPAGTSGTHPDCRCNNGANNPFDDTRRCTTFDCPPCGAGQSCDDSTGQCRDCPDGQISQNGSCVPCRAHSAPTSAGDRCACNCGHDPTDASARPVCARAPEHAHGNACHADHPPCPANASVAVHTATQRTCACDPGFEDTDPDPHVLTCRVIPIDGCVGSQHAHGDVCHANHPPCPSNASVAIHTATQRTCACDEGFRDGDAADGELECLPICHAKTEGCLCREGHHVHDPSGGVDTEWPWGVLPGYDVARLCHPDELRHVDRRCADTGGTWEHSTCRCPEGLEASADMRPASARTRAGSRWRFRA